jgi:hypothetical protein
MKRAVPMVSNPTIETAITKIPTASGVSWSGTASGWASNDPAAIGDLFDADAVYRDV